MKIKVAICLSSMAFLAPFSWASINEEVRTGKLSLVGIRASDTGELLPCPPKSPDVFVHMATNDRSRERYLKVSSCQQAVAELRKLRPLKEVPNGSFPLLVGLLEWRMNEMSRDYLTKEFCGIEPLESRCSSDFSTFEVRITSVVGPITSLEIFSGDAGAGGNNYSTHNWESYDARTTKKAKLSDLFDLESIVLGIQSDSYLKDVMPKIGNKENSEFNRLLTLLKMQEDEFAVAGYDKKANMALVRLGLRKFQRSSANTPNDVVQIGLKLKPKPEFVPYLAQVSEKKVGFFFGQGKNIKLNAYQ